MNALTGTGACISRFGIESAMTDIRYGAKQRLIIQTIAGLFPCQALLHKWGRSASPQRMLCGGEAKTRSHVQCWCPALQEAARIAAHHALAAMILLAFQAHGEGLWQFHIEVAVSSLRAIPVPLDLYEVLNRLIDDLEEPDSITARPQEEHPQDLSRLRLDARAISWVNQQVLLLELNRAYDWRQDWYETTNAFKIQKISKAAGADADPATTGVGGRSHSPHRRDTRVIPRALLARDTSQVRDQLVGHSVPVPAGIDPAGTGGAQA